MSTPSNTTKDKTVATGILAFTFILFMSCGLSSASTPVEVSEPVQNVTHSSESASLMFTTNSAGGTLSK